MEQMSFLGVIRCFWTGAAEYSVSFDSLYWSRFLFLLFLWLYVNCKEKVCWSCSISLDYAVSFKFPKAWLWWCAEWKVSVLFDVMQSLLANFLISKIGSLLPETWKTWEGSRLKALHLYEHHDNWGEVVQPYCIGSGYWYSTAPCGLFMPMFGVLRIA